MEFNQSTRLSLERNYGRITEMQKACEDRYKQQFDYNHSVFERRERIKIESKKGQSKRIGPKKAATGPVSLTSPSSKV